MNDDARQPGTPCSRGREPHLTPRGAPACKGHNRRTGKCCKADPAAGQAVCKWHGAGTPQAKAGAARRLEVERQEQVMARSLQEVFGDQPPPVDPREALLFVVASKYAEVCWLREKMAATNEADLVWGQTKSKVGGDDRGDTYEAKPSIWWTMLRSAEAELLKAAAAAHAAGCEDLRIQVAKRDGAAVARLIRQIVDELWSELLAEHRRLGLSEEVVTSVIAGKWPAWVGRIVPAALLALNAPPSLPRTGELA